MSKYKIGIIAPSEIALRRFLPALIKSNVFEYVGVAISNKEEWFGDVSEEKFDSIVKNEKEKAKIFVEQYGGIIFESYQELLNSSVNAVYIPLPPALHYKWALASLEHGKHIFVEKPFTISHLDTSHVVETAKRLNLAIHENFMFSYHNQIQYVIKTLKSNVLGKIRSYRISFGFPFRGEKDFRYQKSLGGGAFFDCGGYTIKLANILLGNSVKIDTAKLNYEGKYEVDIFGSATMSNHKGETVQISFGMDNNYKCDLEIWGSLGSLSTSRIFTAPSNFDTEYTIKLGNKTDRITLLPDDSFVKSILTFYNSIKNEKSRLVIYSEIMKQSVLANKFILKACELNDC